MERIKSNLLIILIAFYAFVIIAGNSKVKKVNNHSLLHNTASNTIQLSDTVIKK
jgi:hypothetical protein